MVSESRLFRSAVIIEAHNFYKTAHVWKAQRARTVVIKNFIQKLSLLLLLVASATSATAQAQGQAPAPGQAPAQAQSQAQAQAQQKLPNPLNLSQAVNIALSNNSVIREARARLDQASGRYAQSRSTLLPQLEARARQAYLTINLKGLGIDIPSVPQGNTPPFGSMWAGVELKQDLLNIANREAWRSSSAKQDSSRLMIEDAREIVVLDVVATYLQALSTKSLRDSLAEQTKLATDLYNLTEDRVKHGISSKLEANRALQQVNSLQQQQQEAEQNYVAAKLNLANTLQTSITADFDVEDASAYGTEAPVDRTTAVGSALDSRPDFRASKSTVHAAELQIKSAKAYRYPTLSVGGADAQSGESPVHNQNTYAVYGTLNFPIFTGGRIRGQVQEAQGVLREAQANQDKLRTQIETDVLKAISGVEWARKEVETSAANVKLSREEVELSRQRFAQGIVDNTEVVNAQDRVSKADDARVRAMYTLGLARANLARAMGQAEKTYRK